MPVLIIIVAAFVTALVSGVFGMAGGLLLLGVLAAYLPAAQAMALHGMIQAASNGSRAALLARHIVWPIMGFYLIGTACAAASRNELQLMLDASEWLHIRVFDTGQVLWIVIGRHDHAIPMPGNPMFVLEEPRMGAAVSTSSMKVRRATRCAPTGSYRLSRVSVRHDPDDLLR